MLCMQWDINYMPFDLTGVEQLVGGAYDVIVPSST